MSRIPDGLRRQRRIRRARDLLDLGTRHVLSQQSVSNRTADAGGRPCALQAAAWQVACRRSEGPRGGGLGGANGKQSSELGDRSRANAIPARPARRRVFRRRVRSQRQGTFSENRHSLNRAAELPIRRQAIPASGRKRLGGRLPQQLCELLGTLRAIQFDEERIGLASKDRTPPPFLLFVPDPPAATCFGPSNSSRCR